MSRGSTCLTCPIGKEATGFVHPSGTGKNGVLIVDNMMGGHEVRQGKPLVGDSGFMLGQILRRMGLPREDFTLSSLLWCHPPGKIFSDRRVEAVVAQCQRNLDQVIQERQPKVIVALGKEAFYHFTGINAEPEDFRGYVHRDLKDERWVMGTFHPQWLLRGNVSQAPAMMFDLQKALTIAKEGYAYEVIECLENPPMGLWEDYVETACGRLLADRTVPLAFDIETPYSAGRAEDALEEDPSFRINCISFAYEGSRGVTVPWTTPYRSGIQRLLEVENDKLIWNRPYDLPRVVHNGMRVAGSIRDTMDTWHCLYSGLKRGLGYATSILQPRFPMWKHTSYTNPERYSVYDAVALWRNQKTLLRLLRESGALRAYQVMVEAIDDPLLFMSRAGVRIDLERRAILREELVSLKEDTQEEMQALVPKGIRPLKVYKTLKGAEGIVDLELLPGTKKVKRCAQCGIIAKKSHVTQKTVKGPNGQATLF